MSLQYISDSNGVPTGVFIPLSEWENLKEKHNGLEEDLNNAIPQWQKDELDRRLESYKNNPEQVLDFHQAMDDIETELDL